MPGPLGIVRPPQQPGLQHVSAAY